MEEDEDVLWDGSPLHQHLSDQGVDEAVLEKRRPEHGDSEEAFERRVQARTDLLMSGQTITWPEDQHAAILEVHVAKLLLQSDLLVQEDQDFVNNFVLTEDAIVNYEKILQDEERSKSRSSFANVLLFSGSVAAVAGAVFFLSERTKAAATAAAALLPTALAAASTARSSSSNVAANSDLESLVKILLEDMQMFKRLARKSLNLLQGMEMVHSGHMFAINSATGNPYTASAVRSGAAQTPEEESATKLEKALSDRSAFPALRKAAYETTVQLIVAYRQAVDTLMEVSPLAEHVDLKDHYIAFIDLENFGISYPIDKSMSGNEISVKTLRDTVQVALVQQSEYLRRFCLVFNDKVRDEDDKINKAGVLKHVRQMVSTLGMINKKLSRVFEYHQAMGIELTEEKAALTQSTVAKKNSLDLVPLKTVYTSLFSTGLHLQNSLLKVRELEKIFDMIERRKHEEGAMSVAVPPSQGEIIKWLKGFQDIQGELNACVGCLDEGVAQIDVLNSTEKEEKEPNEIPTESSTLSDFEEQKQIAKNGAPPIPLVDTNNDPKEHLDEVFEAVIEAGASERGVEENYDPNEFEEFTKQVQSEQRLLRELKHVLVGKATEHEQREAVAYARMKGQSLPEPEEEVIKCNENSSFKRSDPFCSRSNPSNDGSQGFEDSFVVPTSETVNNENGDASSSDSETSSSSDDRGTVKMCETKEGSPDLNKIPRSVSGQLLNEDDFSPEMDMKALRLENGIKPSPSITSLPPMSRTSKEDVEEKMKVLKEKVELFGRNDSVDSQGGAVETCSISDIRSISTPDLKRAAALGATSSPYVSLEDLTPKAEEANDDTDDDESQLSFDYNELSVRDGDDDSDEASSSDWGSADELDHHVLKTFRRPLRPAAKVNATTSNGLDKNSPRKGKKKVRRTRSKETPKVTAEANSTNCGNSTYLEKQKREQKGLISLPKNPFGFDSALATQVASKAKLFTGFTKKKTEEVFGDSE